MIGRITIISLFLTLSLSDGSKAVTWCADNVGVPDTGADCSKPKGGLSNTSDIDMEMTCKAKPKSDLNQRSVLCVGDSITAGAYSSQGPHSYPAALQAMLGDKFIVSNLGACGASMQKNSDGPYWKRPQMKALLESAADIVILMFGTEDARDGNWDNDGFNGAAQYEKDYRAMIQVLKAMPSQPKIFTVIPPPLQQAGLNVAGFNQGHQTSQTVINHVLPKLLARINAENGLGPPIDAFSAMGGANPANLQNADQFHDGVHPTDMGYAHLAAAVYKGLPASGLDNFKVL